MWDKLQAEYQSRVKIQKAYDKKVAEIQSVFKQFIGPELVVTPRYSSTNGAYYPDKNKIKLSAAYMKPEYLDFIIKRILIHELAHAVEKQVYNATPAQMRQHNDRWKRICREFGYPNATSVDNPEEYKCH